MSVIVPDQIKKVLEEYESKKELFSELRLHGQINAAFTPDQNTPQNIRDGWYFESAAFHFSDSSRREENEWGTYFGPIMSGELKDGTKISRPDISELDELCIDYWEQRSKESQNPILKARYADLVWDLKRIVTGKSPDHTIAATAIDAYVEAAKLKLSDEDSVMRQITYLERALSLATSTNNKEKIKVIKNEILSFIHKRSHPNQIGTWSFLIDTLLENKKNALSENEEKSLIVFLENILNVCSDRESGENFDPWAAKTAADKLEIHYKKANKVDDIKRVVLNSGKSFEQISNDADPLVSMSWLQDVFEKYRTMGLKEDAERVQILIKEKGKTSHKSMKEIICEVKITEQEIDQFCQKHFTDDLIQTLQIVALNFLPRKAHAKQKLEELKKEFPLQALIGVNIISDAQFVSKAGSVDDDFDGRMRMQISDTITQTAPFYSLIFERIKTKYHLNGKKLADCLYDCSPIFDQERKDLVCEGIQAYFDNDFVKSIHVLVPQIEHILRIFLGLLGRPINKFRDKGTMQEKNINDILSDEAIKANIPEDMRIYFQIALADQRGLNIRNRLSHGLMNKNSFSRSICEILINILICLSMIQETSKVNNENKETRKG